MTQKQESNSIRETLAVVVSKLERMEKDIAEINETLKQEYVTRQEFAPIKSLVYGVVGLILTSVISAIAIFFSFKK